MAINLRKGERLELNLKKLKVGLGWEPNDGSMNINTLAEQSLSQLINWDPEEKQKIVDFDLDVSVFMLNSRNEIPSEDYLVFYGNAFSKDGALRHSGDDLTGGNSKSGDDEIIFIDLPKVNTKIQEIVFIVTIHEAFKRNQNFGQVRNAYIRLLDLDTNKILAKYQLNDDFSTEIGIEFGRLYRRKNQWKFVASGIGYNQDLHFFVKKYFKGKIEQ